MVSKEQVKTITSEDFNPSIFITRSEMELRLWERTLEDREMSTPAPRVLFTLVDALPCQNSKLHSNQEVNCDHNTGHLAMSQLKK
jgi:hypothetical protein